MKNVWICLLCLACVYGEKVLTVKDAIRCEIESSEPIVLVSDAGLELTRTGKIIAPKVHFKSVDAPQIHGEVIADEILICCERGQLNLDNAQLSGEIIIDPKNVLIRVGGVDSASGNTFSSQASSDVVIDGATLATAIDSGSVTIQANTDISINDDIIATTSGNGLTLQAGRSIIFEPGLTITLNNGALSATINDQGAIGSDRDDGLAVLSIRDDCTISTSGGNVTFNVGTFDASQVGQMVMKGSSIDAGGGDISITGIASAHKDHSGCVQTNMTFTTSGIGTITVTGTGGNISSISCGIDSYNSSYNVVDGNLSLDGTGRGNVSTGYRKNIGSRIFDSTLTSTGTGNISIVGLAGSGKNLNIGVLLSGTTVITADTGGVDITGTGGGQEAENDGVRIESAVEVIVSSTGHLTIVGVAGGATDNNVGVLHTSNGKLVTDAGTMTIDGTGNGSGNGNSGVVIESDAIVCVGGIGDLDITGEGSVGVDDNMGIEISTLVPMFVTDGAMTINGTAHGTGDGNIGVLVDGWTTVESLGSGTPGPVTVTGTGGTGSNENYGVLVREKADISSSAADITVTGTSLVPGTVGLLEINPSSITSESGIVTLNNIDLL